MRIVLLVALFTLVAPLARADPLLHAGRTYVGVATQDDEDRPLDWHPPTGCLEAHTDFTYTLTFVSAGRGDRLTLRADDVWGVEHVAVAVQGIPVTLTLTESDSCPDFSVEGTRVGDEAPYAVLVRTV